jgi:hypothetical protein
MSRGTAKDHLINVGAGGKTNSNEKKGSDEKRKVA